MAWILKVRKEVLWPYEHKKTEFWFNITESSDKSVLWQKELKEAEKCVLKFLKQQEFET